MVAVSVGKLFSAEITQKRLRNSQRPNAEIQYLSMCHDWKPSQPTNTRQALRKAKAMIVQFFLRSRVTLLKIGPFIREKIRRELDHLYEHVLFKTKTARINGSRLISVLDSFSCECCP